MKFFAIICFLMQAVFMQNAYSQIIRAANPIAISAPVPVIAQSSVANTLADTLSLLTVSSLLSETLPLNPNVITVPLAAPGYGGCGCGCGCGYNSLPYYNNYGYLY